MNDQSRPRAGEQETNGKATWSLVLGILSVTFCGFVAAVVAIVLGKQAQREIADSGGLQGGESRARWGIILGWISVVIYVLAALMALVAFFGN